MDSSLLSPSSARSSLFPQIPEPESPTFPVVDLNLANTMDFILCPMDLITSPVEPIFKIQPVQFLGRTKPIIFNNENEKGWVPAITNTLLLRDDMHIDIKEFNLKLSQVHSLLSERLGEPLEEKQLSFIFGATDPKPTWDRIDGFKDQDLLCDIFRKLHVPLYHGWVVRSENAEAKTYDDIAAIKDQHSGYSDEVRLMLMNPSKITEWGQTCLKNNTEEHGLCVLFHNQQFSVMIKHENELYLLVADEEMNDTSIMWQRVSDDSLVGDDFEYIPMSGTFDNAEEEEDYGEEEDFSSDDSMEAHTGRSVSPTSVLAISTSSSGED